MPLISGGSGGGTQGSEIGYTQITSNTNITDTAEGTATALISPGPLVFDSFPVMVTFFACAITCDTGGAADTVTVTLWEGATQITRLGTVRSVSTTPASQPAVTMLFRFTPTGGTHTYKLAAFATSTTGTPNIVAGAGGPSAFSPAFLRFTKV